MKSERLWPKMRVLTAPDGIPKCYYCGRVFDVHPKVKARQELHAKLCAIEDDDHAARAFHYRKQQDAEADAQTEHWVARQGFHAYAVGSFLIDGICIRLEPGVSPERAMEEFDKSVLPFVREQILKTLDGTAHKEGEGHNLKIMEAKQAGTLHVYDPTWCPATPTVQELYPNGFVRNPDGSVESL